MLETFTVHTFAGRIGDLFVVTYEADRFDLRLHVATAWGEPATADSRIPFTLEFLGPLAPVLPQMTHAISHQQLGAFDLFLVPLGSDGAGSMRYEAVFS